MKKIYLISCLFIALTGCDYTEEERRAFYESCMAENIMDYSVVIKMKISCACKNWSLRKDIKPKNRELSLKQYFEERKKCETEPQKMNFDQRRFCERGFTEIYPSFADIWAMNGLSDYDIAIAGIGTPGIYKRGTNKPIIDCACLKLSLRDDFIIPDTDKALKKELDKEIKKCEQQQ